MFLIGFTIVINAILEMTVAFGCEYNSNGILSRKAFVWKVENESDIEITDATIKTESDNVDGTTTGLENISKIYFTGKITQGKNSTPYENKIIDGNPISYRVLKREMHPGENRCRVTFRHNANNKVDSTDPRVRSTISRLAESCIKAHICHIDRHEVDKDIDLHHQSVQSNINDLVDFYLPRVINNFVVDDRSIELLSECPPNFSEVVVKCSGVKIRGINSIKRVSDISITNVKNSQFDINAVFRFPKFNISFDALELKSPPSTPKFIAGAASFNVTLSFVFGKQSCQASVLQMDLRSLETIPEDLLHGDLQKRELIFSHLKNTFSKYTKELGFDCQQYAQFISDEIGSLIKKNNMALSNNEKKT